MRVAVLGTGIIGGPIVRRLVDAGHAVRAWNRTAAKAEGLGAEVASTPAEAVRGADVAITLLADGPAVDEVMRPVLAGFEPGAVWAQMSTVGVAWADRLAALAAGHGVAMLDAPVMGSRPAAEQGQLLPLASGPQQARERCAPLFEAFSRAVLWLGDEPGLGSRLKVVTNLWIMTTVESLAEVFGLAEGLGVDPARFLETIAGAPFDMQYAHWKGEMMLKREFPAAFTLLLARKDVGLALEAAAAAGVDLPVAAATARQFERAIELGHGQEDMAATYFASAPTGTKQA